MSDYSVINHSGKQMGADGFPGWWNYKNTIG